MSGSAILTNNGLFKIASASPLDQLTITQIAVGDGVNPLDPTATTLVNEVFRDTASAPIRSTTYPDTLIFELNIPPTTGGFTTREIGAFDSDGDLIAVGTLDEVVKPNDGINLTVRINVKLANSEQVDVFYDNVGAISLAGLKDRRADLIINSDGTTAQDTYEATKQFSRTFLNLADVISGTNKDGSNVDMSTLVGQSIYKLGYFSPLDGGDNHGIVKDGAHTEDGGKFTTISGSLYVEWDIKSNLNAKKYGVFPSLTFSNPTQLNRAIEYISLIGGGSVMLGGGTYSHSGSVFLKDGVWLKCAGSGFTVIDTGNNAIPAVTTDTKTETPITQTSDFLRGGISNAIATSAQEGDFIRYKNANRFTDRWAAAEIRPFYLEAELMKVKSNAGGVVTFDGEVLLDFPVAAGGKDVVTFTPNKNIAVTGLTVKKNASLVSSAAIGVNINQCDNVRVDDLETLNYDNIGLRVNKSLNVKTGTTKHAGGDSSLGLNYGVGYLDGSKNCTHSVIISDNCRHAITSGGTGWGIPMFISVDTVQAKNSSSHAVDCHGNSAFFSFDKVIADTGTSLSGWGHTCNSAIGTSMKGTYSVPYEGGLDQKYGKVTCLGGVNGGIYSDHPVLNFTFDSYTLESEGISILALSSGSEKNTFGSLRIVNIGVSTAASAVEADALCTANSLGLLFQKDLTVNSGYFEGIPIGLYCVYDNVNYSNIELVNCGWSTALTSNDSVVFFSAVDGSSVSNVKFKITNDNLETNGIALRMNGTGSKNSIRDLIESSDSTNHLAGAINTTASHTELRMDNVRIDFGSVTNLAAGKFSFVRGVTDN